MKTFKQFVNEGFDLPIEVGDVVAVGKWKNKKIIVKSIEVDPGGDLLINGKKVAKFRILPQPPVEPTEGM